ncbi:hypothetical protein SASPL_150811 [Salvia splendens]|uniref:PGG domain-containing protein n=1 Tax=Salvia splendens TaxID=180675 RepID=A0A8X8W7F4_SALSN|nr:hypothetical protein SASPL_150811 [Salvia splendens]
MERLQTKLFEAATQNSITSLQQLLIDDPLILERALVNRFNETPLHVAAMLGHVDFVREIIGLQPQLAVKYLVSVGAVDVDAKNEDGLTAMDVLTGSRRDVRDPEIAYLLKHGDKPAKKKEKKNSVNGLLKQHAVWLEKEKNTLMVVASLIATMTFQVGTNPPDGLWKTYATVDYSKNFYIGNTVAFISSLSIILLLTSGLPIRRRFFMWILMVIIWIAISASAWSYITVIVYLKETESDSYTAPSSYTDPQVCTVIVWLGLMFLLLVGHTIRLIVWVLKKLGRGVLKCKRSLC